jgi:hypothetical protein
VVFTPTLPNGAPLLFTSVPFVATPLPVTAVYNDAGQLTLNDVVGVRLIATDNPLETYTNWLWTATFTVAVGDVEVDRNSSRSGCPATRPWISRRCRPSRSSTVSPPRSARRATRVSG